MNKQIECHNIEMKNYDTTSNTEDTHTDTDTDQKTYSIVTFECPPQVTPASVSPLSVSHQDLIQRPQTLPKIESESLQSVSDLQWNCPELSPILQYKVNGIVPNDAAKARKLVAESDMYIILDNVLYHCTPLRSKGVPKPMQMQRQLAVPTQLREDVLLCYHDGPGGSHFGFDKSYS